MADKKVDVSSLTAQDLLALSPEVLAEALFLHPQRGAMGRAKPAEFHLLAAMTPISNVEVALFEPNTDKILLTWRQDVDFAAHHFPGGAMHQFDSYGTACARVVKKELGITIHPSAFQFICLRNYNGPETDKRHFKGVEYPNHFDGKVFGSVLKKGMLPTKEGLNWGFYCTAPDTLLESHRRFFGEVQNWWHRRWVVPIIQDMES